MSFFDKRQTGRIKKPLFLALYSGPGVGKTDFAASFPKPHFFDFEESTHSIDVSRNRPTSWEELYDDLIEIYNTDEEEFKEKGIQSIVFDTIDELERLIHNCIAERAQKDSIENIGWQRGFTVAVNYWADLISICRQIRDKHKVHFVFLAHSFSKGKTNLEKEAYYARYVMALHPKAADYIFGQVEMVLFARKDIAFKTVDDKTFAKDLENRILCTSLSAYYDAKNRIGLPAELPMPHKNAFNILNNAYEVAFNETPETAYKACLEEMKGIKDEKLKEVMKNYVDENKENLIVLRECLLKIKQNKNKESK